MSYYVESARESKPPKASMSFKAALLLVLAASALVLAARPANQQFQISGKDEHSYGAVVSGRIFEPSAESFELQHSARVSRRAQPLPKALQNLEQAISHLQDTANMKHVSSVSFNAKLGMGTKKALEFSHPLVMRRAKDFEPEGVHLMCPGRNHMLVSFQTGESRVGPSLNPPKAHDVKHIPKQHVRFSSLDPSMSDKSKIQMATSHHSLTYSYVYGPDQGDSTYRSPVLHHVLLGKLKPGVRYYYQVGSDQTGWSQIFDFVQPDPKAQKFRIGVAGDLGQTLNTTSTLASLASQKVDAYFFVGDYSYADKHVALSHDKNQRWNMKHIHDPFSDQRRWDTWTRLMEGLLASAPMVGVMGNHDVEMQIDNGFKTFTAANARFPMPVDAGLRSALRPNHGNTYLDVASNFRRFRADSNNVEANNSYWGVEIGPVHLIGLNVYVPWGPGSLQAQWLENELKTIDRINTPWVIVGLHLPPYHSYRAHFRSCDLFLEHYEPLFMQYGVDIVLSGHVHAYERTMPMYNYEINECGPIYITSGDGGNLEGLASKFIDEHPHDYCSDPSKFHIQHYSPMPPGKIPRFKPFVNAKGERTFCPEKQPAWSAYRESSFGHGIIDVEDSRHLLWQFYRTVPGGHQLVDSVELIHSEKCPNQLGKAAQIKIAQRKARLLKQQQKAQLKKQQKQQKQQKQEQAVEESEEQEMTEEERLAAEHKAAAEARAEKKRLRKERRQRRREERRLRRQKRKQEEEEEEKRAEEAKEAKEKKEKRLAELRRKKREAEEKEKEEDDDDDEEEKEEGWKDDDDDD